MTDIKDALAEVGIHPDSPYFTYQSTQQAFEAGAASVEATRRVVTPEDIRPIVDRIYFAYDRTINTILNPAAQPEAEETLKAILSHAIERGLQKIAGCDVSACDIDE